MSGLGHSFETKEDVKNDLMEMMKSVMDVIVNSRCIRPFLLKFSSE